jgi:hypothetical protein
MLITDTSTVTKPDHMYELERSWVNASRILTHALHSTYFDDDRGWWLVSGYELLDRGLISKTGHTICKMKDADEEAFINNPYIVVVSVLAAYAWVLEHVVNAIKTPAPPITAEPAKEYDCHFEPRVPEDDAPWSEMYSPLKVLFRGKDPASGGRSPHIGRTQLDDAVKQLTAGGTLHGGLTILETTAAPDPDMTMEANLTWADTMRILRHAHQHQIRYCLSYPGADWGISGFELLDAGLIDNHAQVTCKLDEAEEQACAEAGPNSWIRSVMAMYVDLLTANCPGDPRIKQAQVWMRELHAKQVLVTAALATVN